MSKPVKFLVWSVLLTIIFIEAFVLVSPAYAAMVIASVSDNVDAVIHPAPKPVEVILQPVAQKLTCPLGKPPHGLGYYPVHDGETAQIIADKFHIAVTQVITLNPDAAFHSGEIIYLPAVEGPWDNGALCPDTTTTTTTGAASTALSTTPAPTSTVAQTVTSWRLPKGNSQCPLAPAGHAMGYYPIHKGETLQEISAKFRVPVKTILELNPNTPFERGKVLVLPAAEGPWDNGYVCPENVTYLVNYKFGNARRTCPLAGLPQGFGYYKVIKGDTPQSIAAKFRTPLDTVLLLNSGYSFDRGSILMLPAVEGPWNNGILCP
jgi:LysM repeat protein